MLDFTEQKRDALARHLRRHIKGEVRFDLTSRRLYSTDASIYQIDPLGVVIPRSVEDLVTTVQVAVEAGVSITARGGGTSLSGQSIGPGVVLDCSKYLNRVLDFDPGTRRIRVQPGLVLDQLNRAVAAEGLQFGPDVATADRANLGGMIGNNSAGARSVIYGKTLDHVRRLGVILSDGSCVDLRPVTPSEWQRKAQARTREGEIYRTVAEVIHRHGPEIERRFPRLLRRVSGYNLDALLSWFRPPSSGAAAGANGSTRSAAEWTPTPAGLQSLVVGAEGTLAVVAEAELQLVPRPRCRALLVPHFATLAAALEALAPCLEVGPSAVELMDRMLLDLARGHRALQSAVADIEGRAGAVFMVEFSGDDPAEVAGRVERLAARLRHQPGITALVPALDPARRDPLWGLRSAALPLLMGVPGDRKPVTFVEDTAVPPERLPEFAAAFEEVLRRHGTQGAFYGHASVGCLHIRPVLNLKDAGDVARMRRITQDVTDLVLRFGGALSGEHGDGLARSEWNRKMFGEEVYEAFRQVKRAFDPGNLLNPGKVVDAPAMTENLRYGPAYSPAEPSTVFDYSGQEGFVRAIELCNGAGVCRKLQGGTMCPSFRATRDEKDSTRARANILRRVLSGAEPARELRGCEAYDVLDLCLMCKACKTECPSGVDMAKLKAEFLHLHYRHRPRPLGQALVARIYRLNRLGSAAAPLVNRLQRSRWLRWLLEKMAGIDRRRTLPRFRLWHFRRWFAGHTPPPAAGRYGRVVLLDDCFTTFQEPAIGRSAVRVLEHAGYTVELDGLTCCGRPLISKGYLDEARALVADQAPRLARRVAEGLPVLGLEPSCLLTLADEWPELLPGPETKRVADAAELADGWLARQTEAGRSDLMLRSSPRKVLLHAHCHQKALYGSGPSARALGLVPDLTVRTLDTGCCGMAGSFGYEREHYEISVAIANLALLPALEAAPEATVVATGTSCRQQILDLAARRAYHPLELLAEALDVPKRAR